MIIVPQPYGLPPRVIPRNPADAADPPGRVRIQFTHGLGDHVTFAHVLQLYRRRGFTVSITGVGQDLHSIYAAAGVAVSAEPAGAPFHNYPHPPRFNEPVLDDDGVTNKAAHAINHAPMPRLKGDRKQLWEELCSVQLRVTPSAAARAHAAAQVAKLPRPLFALHPCTYFPHEHNGHDMPQRKNLAEATARELVERIHAAGGSTILLNWNGYASAWPETPGLRCVRDRLERSPENLCALFELVDALVAIDSGPLHVASLTEVPALGVFHEHYPTEVMLPRARSALLTRGRYAAMNVTRRQRWNILEYPGEYPTAEEILHHALRVAAGPCYLSPELLGRDLMLQQWVDRMVGGKIPCRFHGAPAGLTITSDRRLTIDRLLREATARFERPRILETGCIRPGAGEDWAGAGNSTYLLAAYAAGRGGSFISIDNEPANVEYARAAIASWGGAVTCSDSVAALAGLSGPVDVLYLDSHDADLPGHAEHALAEIQAALPALHERSLIAFDDTIHADNWHTVRAGTWLGKGRLAVPWLLERGWRILAEGYQQVLGRPIKTP